MICIVEGNLTASTHWHYSPSHDQIRHCCQQELLGYLSKQQRKPHFLQEKSHSFCMKKNLYNSWSLIELSPGGLSCFTIDWKFVSELMHQIQRRWEWWCVTIAVPLKCSYSCFQVNIYFLQIWVSGEKEMFLKCPQQQFLQDSTKPLEQLILGLNTTCNIFFICGDGQFMVSSADLKICNTTLQSSNIPYSFFLQAGEAKIQLGCYSMQIWVAKDGKQLAQKGQNNQLEIWPQRPRYFTAAATITMHYTPWGWNFPWGVELSMGADTFQGGGTSVEVALSMRGATTVGVALLMGWWCISGVWHISLGVDFGPDLVDGWWGWSIGLVQPESWFAPTLLCTFLNSSEVTKCSYWQNAKEKNLQYLHQGQLLHLLAQWCWPLNSVQV